MTALITDVFQYRQSMWNLEHRMKQNRLHFRDVSVLGNFIDNHDVQRFLSVQSDETLLRNALTYVMMMEGKHENCKTVRTCLSSVILGIPIIYYGTSLHFSGGDDPNNRESAWPEVYERTKRSSTFQIVQLLNQIRKIGGRHFVNSQMTHLWTEDNVHVFERHDAIVVLSNLGRGHSTERTVKIPQKKGTKFYNGRC
jgi:alpha-amylase